MIAQKSKEYSVNIAGRLVLHDRTVPVGQICGRFLVIVGECEIPPNSQATLIVTVDGREKVYHIFIPKGIDRETNSYEFF